MWRNYHTVTSIERALELLGKHGSRARLIAGGTDILIELERNLRPEVDTLIDITRVVGLDRISQDKSGFIRMGPLVTHNQCVTSSIICANAWPLAQACWEVGAPQIRNRSTVAGNLITASPANDTITPLIAMGGTVTLRSVSGERRVPLSDFYLGVRQTVMLPEEMLTEISFPALRVQDMGMFLKLGLRRAQAIAVVNVTAIVGIVDSENGMSCDRVRIAIGAVAPTIVRAVEAERFLQDRLLDEAVIERASELAAGASRPIDDLRGSAKYRSKIVSVLARRALLAIHEGDTRGEFPKRPALLGCRVDGRPEGYLVTDWSTAGNGSDEPIVTTVNGREYTVRGANHKNLLRMLREDLGLIGTKEGCSEGECGACTVHLDGAAVMSCLVPAPRSHQALITTVEGLADKEKLHPLQQAFIDAGAVQCGYCTPGLLMAGAKFLDECHKPTGQEIEHAITGNLCRCTGYYKVFAAMQQASTVMSRRDNL